MSQNLGGNSIGSLNSTLVAVGASDLGKAIKQAIDFESAMAGVKKVVEGTPEEFQKLNEQIQQLGVDLGLGSVAVAELAAAGGQLGVPIDELAKFSEMAGKMSVAFNMTADEAGNAAAKLANVFNIPVLEVEKLGDAINTLGNNTAAKEREIVEAMLRIGGSARQFGLAEEQAASLAAAMISLGKSPEVAATGINALLTKLMTAQSQGKEFQSALAGIGLSADQLAQQIAANPQQALSNFLGKLAELPKQQQAIINSKLFGAEYADDIALLTQNLDQFQKALALTSDKAKNAGAMNAEFAAASATTSAQIKAAEASLDNLLQTIGTQFLPIVQGAAKGFTALTQELNELAKAHPTIAAFATSLLAIKSTLAGVNALTGALSTTGLTNASTATETLATRMETLVSWTQKATALFAAFEVGESLGTWLRESSDWARALGDELARGLAYLDALVTERTLEDVATQFETSREASARLARETEILASQQETLAKQSALATESQKTQTLSAEDYQSALRSARAEIATLQAFLEVMTEAGLENSLAFAETEEAIEKLGESIRAMPIVKPLDLEYWSKYEDALETLGLSFSEFETGVSESAQKAVDAFSVLATNTQSVEQLARAYNAARDAVGQSAEGQKLLQSALQESTAHTTGLADKVIQTAENFKDFSQKAVDSAQQAQSALASLGVSLEDVKRGLSSGVSETVDNWRVGFGYLKESGELTATAVQSAFERAKSSLNSAEDFKALQSALQETGSAALLTTEQMHVLQVGAQGGAAAVKQIELAYQNVSEQSQKTAQAQIQAHQASSQSALENAKAVEKVAESVKKAGEQSETTVIRLYQKQGLLKDQIAELETHARRWEEAFFKAFVGRQTAQVANNLAKHISQLSKQMRAANEEIEALEGKIQDGTLSMSDLEAITKKTQSAFSLLDKATLSRLNQSIDKAREKLGTLRDEAKDTADELEAKLSSLKGDDSKARALEQAKELQALEEKRQSALGRGNRDEVAEYERALALQRQIHAEQNKQDAARKQQEAERKTKGWGAGDTSPAGGVGAKPSAEQETQSALSAEQVASAWDKRIQEAEKRGAQHFAQELYNAAKRRAY
ncbi:MAG: phage tail tape measure protein [Cardiobacteriaceae bacterium]|nr:phage tail tape measure protein [Cardiobacteriaceae bacterium]